MRDNSMVLVVGGYQDVAIAQHDFDAMAALVKGKRVSSQGMILIVQDADGEVPLEDSGDHLGRKGMG